VFDTEVLTEVILLPESQEVKGMWKELQNLGTSEYYWGNQLKENVTREGICRQGKTEAA
jgi:hypothetical protein